MKNTALLTIVLLLVTLGVQVKGQTPLENLTTPAWSVVTGGHYTGSNTSANAIDGNATTGWEAEYTEDYMYVAWPVTHMISEVHLGKSGAPTGAAMPVSYTISFYNGGTLVRTIVNEVNNTQGDVIYQLPGMVVANSVYITVTGTQGAGLPWINEFNVYGPFIPEILSPVSSQTVANSPFAVTGYTQPGSSVTLTLNGTALPAVTADPGGWFSANSTLLSGSNTVSAIASLSGNISAASTTTTTTYSSTATVSPSLITRDGGDIAFDEGTNEVLVLAGGQGSSVAYTITDENNAVLTSGGTGTVDLTKGAARIQLPASKPGWYQIALSTTPALTQTVSILSNRAILPRISRISSEAGLSVAHDLISTNDAPYVTPVISAYVGQTGFGWLRDTLSWNTVNDTYGTYNWTNFDTNEGALAAQQESIMPNVYSFPDNATVNSHRDFRYVPDNLYTSYIWGQQIASHFNTAQFGYVKAYEFQNEWDDDLVSTNPKGTHSRQTVNTLMGHQRAFYLGVKSVNTNLIVLPNPPAFINDAVNEQQNLRGEAMDAFAYHWYPSGLGTTNMVNLQGPVGGNPSMSNAMQTVIGPLENRAAWMTECGFGSTGSLYANNNVWSADEQYQADFVSKMGPLALAYGVDHPFQFIFPHYNPKAPGSGALRYTNFSPQSAVNAMETTSQVLQNGTFYGTLNSGNPSITGLLFKNGTTSLTFQGYILEIWSTAAAGNGAFTLPNGVTFTHAVDYLGRVTDTGTTTSVLVQPTAKFINLTFTTANDNAITASAFSAPSTNPYPNPSIVGINPSPVIMEWHFGTPNVSDLICKSTAFEDYYDMPNGTTTTGYLEVVNTSSTTPFSGTINVTTSNQRWPFALQSGQSLSVSSLGINGGRATIGFTLTAPTSLQDVVRLEARVDDNFSPSKTSSAAEILQSTASTTPVNVIVQDGTGTVTVPAYAATSGVAAASQNTPMQNYLGFDGHLAWMSGTDSGGVVYEQALPSSGTLRFTSQEKFKAPVLHYSAGLTSSLTTFYVWIKAKAPTTGGVFFDINSGSYVPLNFYTGILREPVTEINGFNPSSWTWSRTAVVGGSGGVANFNSGTINSGTVPFDVAVWPSNDGVQIADIVIRTDSSSTPPGF